MSFQPTMLCRLYKKIDEYHIECYYIETQNVLTLSELRIIEYCVEPNMTEIQADNILDNYIEVGSYLHMITPYCSNAMSIFKKCNIDGITRIEKTRFIHRNIFSDTMMDPMLETIYDEVITTFQPQGSEESKDSDELDPDVNYNMYASASFTNSNLIGNEDVSNIEEFNKTYQLGFDEHDIQHCNQLYQKLNRSPKAIELFDLSQSNSEHSRHWFFKGKLHKNGVVLPTNLFQMIKSTQKHANQRSVVAFSDNASAIRGFWVNVLQPSNNPEYKEYNHITQQYHLTFTAETHNFSTGVAPFQGAATGIGGRLREQHAIGCGGHTIAGTVGYCVGNIFDGPYRDKNIKTLIEASNGCSDYGNKFGEPIIGGFCRSFGMNIKYNINRDHGLLYHTLHSDHPIEETIEWVKPIMFTGGIGQMDHRHITKGQPRDGDLIIKLGGPAYRIGTERSASSGRYQNTKNHKDDLNAVQRGDPEMENRLHRVIRSCIELGENNPIVSIHDQGAGGTANVTKEIIYPRGGIIFIDNIHLGDPSMTPLEIWISEYQEQDTILVRNCPEKLRLLRNITQRENLPMSIIGVVKNTGRIEVRHQGSKIMDLPLEPILGNDIPAKEYQLGEILIPATELLLPQRSLWEHLQNVFKLPSVGSKRFLTTKVDRSVTGLIAQQQCVGYLETPLSNYSVVAQSYVNLTGGVTAIGEQPIKGLINPGALGRMAVSEMLLNMVFAKITSINDIRCSGNWMFPIKAYGEKDALCDACQAMCDMVKKLGFAFDGGKDSLSMSYTDHQNGTTIKCPRSLVVSGYAPMPDIRRKVTPDFKSPNSDILFLHLSIKQRLGGTALAQSVGQLGNHAPDVENISLLGTTFVNIQRLLEHNKILAGHDRSDGGLLTTICEMAIAGGYGFNLDAPSENPEFWFNEEPGLILEVNPQWTTELVDTLGCIILGTTTQKPQCIITCSRQQIFNESLHDIRDAWESTSWDMELRQCHPQCVQSEKASHRHRHPITYKFDFDRPIISQSRMYKVGIIRDEGSNGDRELAAAFHMSGFQVFDICINDLINKTTTLDSFQGIAFVGGFTYADVFGAANGWHKIIETNSHLKEQFQQFRNRPDTFAMGVCNGCQLMIRMGWVSGYQITKNTSGRFESRFSNVSIESSNSLFLTGMSNSCLGIWVAHAEGQFVRQSSATTIDPPVIHYVDDDGHKTTQYPMNPNGSIDGIAGVSSSCGRFLAMMPHPERCFLNWQLPVSFGAAQIDGFFSPWFFMFKNAYQWCEKINPLPLL